MLGRPWMPISLADHLPVRLYWPWDDALNLQSLAVVGSMILPTGVTTVAGKPLRSACTEPARAAARQAGFERTHISGRHSTREPPDIGTYRSVETTSSPSDNRGQERSDARRIAGELLGLDPPGRPHIITLLRTRCRGPMTVRLRTPLRTRCDRRGSPHRHWVKVRAISCPVRLRPVGTIKLRCMARDVAVACVGGIRRADIGALMQRPGRRPIVSLISHAGRPPDGFDGRERLAQFAESRLD
jgi:hypothetical protein